MLYIDDFISDFSSLLDTLSDSSFIGNYVNCKRKVKKYRKSKKKYYKFCKYYAGVLDYIPGSKEILLLSLNIIRRILYKKVSKK